MKYSCTLMLPTSVASSSGFSWSRSVPDSLSAFETFSRSSGCCSSGTGSSSFTSASRFTCCFSFDSDANANSLMSFSATFGCFVLNTRSSSNVKRPTTVAGFALSTVAIRTPPWNIASSPRDSPASMEATRLPPMITSADPLDMNATKEACWPFFRIVVPCPTFKKSSVSARSSRSSCEKPRQ